jgi:hypothetical protein
VQGIKAMIALGTSASNPDPDMADFSQIVSGLSCDVQDQTVTAQCPVPLKLIAGTLERKGVAFHYDKKSVSVGVNEKDRAAATRP